MQDYLVLNRTGDRMPLVGFGTARISDQDTEQVVYNAIKIGYRLIDTAQLYANEKGVGRAIKRAVNDGLVTRQELFVVTKIWNCYHSASSVRPMLDRQLKDLGLDYVDLYHIHFPIPAEFVDPDKHYPPTWKRPDGKKVEMERSPLQDMYRELEKAVDDGKIRNIGISNFNVQLTLDLLTYCKYKPAVLQVELHPYLQQSRLVRWMQQQEIQVTAYSSFGPAAFDEMPKIYENVKIQSLFQHPVITEIAKKHGKSAPQVLLKWSVDRGVAVIPKSVSEERMRENRDLFSWSLDEKDHEAIAGLNQNMRFNLLVDGQYGMDLPLFE